MRAMVFAAALVVAAPALAADDPAVLVCEEIIKSEIRTPRSYTRARAVIDGLQVHVSYDAVNFYNAPIRHSYTCQFSADGDGRFSLANPSLEGLIAELRDITDRANDSSAYGSLTTIEREAMRARVDAIQLEAANITARAMHHLLLAASLPFFPIDPDATKLRAPD